MGINFKNKNDICVIGTGRFGEAIIGQLLKMNKSVFVIDKKEENIKLYADEVERAVVADAADMKALEALKIYQMETVVVAVPENIEIVAALLELGIKNIIARATSKRHARVLKQIGVNVIIRPESESGIRTALIAANDSFIKYSENLLELGDDFVMGATTIKNKELDGKTIKHLAMHIKGVTIILIKRNQKSMRAQGDTKILLGDVVSLVGKVDDVTNVLDYFNEEAKK